MKTGNAIFDRSLLRRRRDRAANHLAGHDFFLREVGERLADRLCDVARPFPCALDLGCHGGHMAEILAGRGAIQTLVQCDLSPAMAARTVAAKGGLAVVGDEEALPFADQSFDLVLSCLSLHLVNALPEVLAMIRQILKPEGLFLAAMAGEGTLSELRQTLTQAEMDVRGGAAVRVAPFADVRGMGHLLQRAGFTLPVVDVDVIPVRYANPLRLLHDLRGAGQSVPVFHSTGSPLSRAILDKAQALYRRDYPSEGGVSQDGRVSATAHVLYLTGWVS